MRGRYLLFVIVILMAACVAVHGIDIKTDGTGMSQKDLVTYLVRLRDAINNRHMAVPTVEVSATDTRKIHIVNTDTWFHGGVGYASASDIATFTAMTGYSLTSFATNQQSMFVFGRLSTGLVRVIQGNIASTVTQTANLPEIPASMTPIFQVLVVASGSNASFTAGTSICSSTASITTTIKVLGARPVPLQD